MNVAVMIVGRLSLSCSMVLEAIIPGIPQPDEDQSGMKLLPDSPKCLNTRSITNAIRTIYPQSSRIEREKEQDCHLWILNPSTAPIPPMIPSTTNPSITLLTPALQVLLKRYPEFQNYRMYHSSSL